MKVNNNSQITGKPQNTNAMKMCCENECYYSFTLE